MNALSGRPLRLFASPWSAPGWMKTNGHMKGGGVLFGKPGEQYYRTWANYFVRRAHFIQNPKITHLLILSHPCRFFDAYQAMNISFWALTVQNEPTSGFLKNYKWQTMGLTADTMRDFVKLDLGPTMRASQHANVKTMIVDDNRLVVNIYADRVCIIIFLFEKIVVIKSTDTCRSCCAQLR